MTLLALHGFTQTPAQWEGFFDVVSTPWLPGHGPSPDTLARTFEEAVDRFASEFAQAPEPHIALGYSMGARVVLGALVRHPGLIDRAILIGVQPGLRTEEEREARASWERGLSEVLQEQGLVAFLQIWENLPLFASQRAGSTAELQRGRRLCHSASGLSHALDVLGLAHMPNYWDALESIECPVELVIGANDEKFAEIAQQMETSLRSARVHAIGAAGHNPLLDEPDATQSLLRRLVAAPFLSQRRHG